MKARIKSISESSLAYRLGIRPGDTVVSVNGNSNLEDMFDFEFEIIGEPQIMLAIEKSDGQTSNLTLDISDGDLGFQFDSPIFTPIKTCNNACPFCFIDQQPEGLRATLYVKDDDYRLSYFCNTYITLTNLTRHDRERIARIRPGPLYVSVHSTVPEIREQLLINKKAGEIMSELRWLASLEIPFHAQLVICPGINDGESLTTTLEDLWSLNPHCLSVAVVPVGLTQFRGSLPNLVPMSPAIARDVIQRVGGFTKKHQTQEFAFASDEFYVRAELPMPGYESYGDFPQLEDGVGTARLLTQEFFELEKHLPAALPKPASYLAITGKLGAMILQPIIQRLNQVEGLFLDLLAIENEFWGQSVTVSGLITGQDIINHVSTYDLSGYQGILIPETMLKSGEAILLDGITIPDLESRLGIPFIIVRKPSRAESLLEILFGDLLQKA